VDTPGFQEFGLAHLTSAQIVAAFPEFESHLGRCRFADCRHLVEPDCAIRTAVAAGDVASGRYDFYRSLIEGNTQ
jgi:ribosome biogenesis GTPase